MGYRKMKLLYLGFYHGTLRSFYFRTGHTKISPPFCSNHFSACYNVSQLNYSTTFQHCTLRFFANTWDYFAILRHDNTDRHESLTIPVHALPIRYITFCFNSIPIHFRTLHGSAITLLFCSHPYHCFTLRSRSIPHSTSLFLTITSPLVSMPSKSMTIQHSTFALQNLALLHDTFSLLFYLLLFFTFTMRRLARPYFSVSIRHITNLCSSIAIFLFL